MSVVNGGSLESGLVGRKGLLNEEQFQAAYRVLQQVEMSGVETIRLAFVDQHGIPRGKAIVAQGLSSAIKGGVAMTSTLLLKDTSHRTVFSIWSEDIGLGEGTLTGASDVLMVPDPSTFRILPWSSHSASMLCTIHYKDGSEMPFCARSILKRAVTALASSGKALVCGLEVEFYVLKVEDLRLAHKDGGMPANPPETSLLSHGYQYLTESRYDALEPVMDELRRAAQALGLPVRSMEAEFGPASSSSPSSRPRRSNMRTQ